MEATIVAAANRNENETLQTPPAMITMKAQPQYPSRGLAPQVGRFILCFVELQILMGLGALVCYLLGRLIPASSRLATVYHPGTYLFAAGDVLFLTVPVVVWMFFRGQGLRHSLEMTVAMIAPVAVIAVLGEMAGNAYLLWLITAMYPAMSLGMFVHMLYRRNRFKERADHLAHPTPVGR
jgi:hypothetical protein